MVDHIRDLVRHELHVQRIEHRAFRGDGEHDLDVLRAVVQQRGDTLVAVDAQVAVQRVRKSRGARANLGERSLLRAGCAPRRALRVGVGGGAELQNPGDGERHLLHR